MLLSSPHPRRGPHGALRKDVISGGVWLIWVKTKEETKKNQGERERKSVCLVCFDNKHLLWVYNAMCGVLSDGGGSSDNDMMYVSAGLVHVGSFMWGLLLLLLLGKMGKNDDGGWMVGLIDGGVGIQQNICAIWSCIA